MKPEKELELFKLSVRLALRAISYGDSLLQDIDYTFEQLVKAVKEGRTTE